MATTVSSVTSDNMADALQTDIGANPQLVLYTAADAALATLTYTGSGVVGGTNPITITYAHTNFTDETNATAGTVSYAALETSGGVERVRFSAPITDIGLSSATLTAGQTVDCDTDIVIQMPNHT